jgi:hypothetical protein
MTNLENFLNKKDDASKVINVEIVDGAFVCQNTKCDVISYEAIMDLNDGSTHWTCICGHRSSFKL